MEVVKSIRFHELDGLRGLAALTVFFSHLIGAFNFSSDYFTKISNSPLHLFWHGEGAVQLFFILSGFVLTLPYMKNPINLNLVSFYIKRVLRIYPVFLFTIIFSIFLKSFLYDANQMVSYSNWINLFWKWQFSEIPTSEILKTLILIGPSFNKDLFDPVIGTLRTEMGMSLILPFFIILALRLRLVINIFIFIVFFLTGKDVFCMFFLGIIMAMSHNKISHYMNQLSNHTVLILFLISIVLYTADFFLNNILSKRLIDGFEILGGALFIILALKNGIFKNILNTRIIHFLGKISYSLYLLHLPILLVCLSLLNDFQYLVFPISLMFTVLLSYLSYEYIELFFISVGRKVKCDKVNSIIDKCFFNFIKWLSFKSRIATSTNNIKK